MIVNRLWQHHFTRGIVATPSDFGVRGEYPSHPELLDWLADQLIKEGWRLKPIHRLMVTSAVYRQSSKPLAKLTELDEENALLGRMNRRRLDAEGVRDAMLAVSGELNLKMGGRGVLAPLEKEVKDLIFTEAEVVDLWPVDPDPHEHHRRALYLFKKRNVRYPLLESFDAPDNQTACPRRETSTHALQALNLLNSETAIGRARRSPPASFAKPRPTRPARRAGLSDRPLPPPLLRRNRPGGVLPQRPAPGRRRRRRLGRFRAGPHQLQRVLVHPLTPNSSKGIEALMAVATAITRVQDLLDDLGGISPWRVLLKPAPGTATEADLIAVNASGRNSLRAGRRRAWWRREWDTSSRCWPCAISALLHEFVDSRNLGIVTGEAGMVRLFPGMIRVPDVAYASWDRFPGGVVPREPMPTLAPELVVEVLSESNTKARDGAEATGLLLGRRGRRLGDRPRCPNGPGIPARRSNSDRIRSDGRPSSARIATRL